MSFNKTSTLFMFITNNCNLKCLGCMQSCDRITNPYYMSLQELENALKVLQTKHFTINGLPIGTIHLTGGDPLTHPQLIKFCELINQYLPEIGIDISTNGLLLKKFTDSQLKYLYNKCKTIFQLSVYADTNLLKMYKNIKKRFDDLGIKCTFCGGSHFYFSKQDKATYPYDQRKEKSYVQQCQQRLDDQNHVILYKGKIYTCWKEINIVQKENNTTIDKDDNYKLDRAIPNELMQNKKHYYCDICHYYDGSGGREYILWQHHNKNADIVFNSSLKDLFIYQYPLYYNLQHNCKNYLEILQDELFIESYSEDQKKYSDIRFFNGKGDIFIPFKEKIHYPLLKFLENINNIDKYNIYFISINNTPQVEADAYELFCPFNNDKINSYFLKANNMLNAYNTFLNNSYLSNKFVIDIEKDNNFKLLPLL